MPFLLCDIFDESRAILRAQTSPTHHYQQNYLKKRDRTDMGSEKASRHDKQLSGKLQWGVEQEEEDQEKDQMGRGPDQDLHHSPLDRVCRLTHEPPV